MRLWSSPGGKRYLPRERTSSRGSAGRLRIGIGSVDMKGQCIDVRCETIAPENCTTFVGWILNHESTGIFVPVVKVTRATIPVSFHAYESMHSGSRPGHYLKPRNTLRPRSQHHLDGTAGI